jgi:Ca2+-binding EF-hand superfamily protein
MSPIDGPSSTDVVDVALESDYSAVFEIIDRDHSGSLELSELKNLLEMMGSEVDVNGCLEKLAAYDTDYNGSALSLEEFKILMKENIATSVRHY